jgi:hypothetical protein
MPWLADPSAAAHGLGLPDERDRVAHAPLNHDDRPPNSSGVAVEHGLAVAVLRPAIVTVAVDCVGETASSIRSSVTSEAVWVGGGGGCRHPPHAFASRSPITDSADASENPRTTADRFIPPSA